MSTWRMVLAAMALAAAMPIAAQAAPWDGEWEGTLKHPDLPCSPCKVRVTVTDGTPSIRSAAPIPSFTISSDGTLALEMAFTAAGNGVRSNCRLNGRAQSSGMAASGTCGLYAVYAEMDLRRVSAAPPGNSATAAAPAATPAPNPAPPAPAPSAPVVSPPAVSPPAVSPPAVAAPVAPAQVPAGFGANTQPVRLGAMTYGIDPGTVVGRITTGSWLSACGTSGRVVPFKHQAGTQPNTKLAGEEFQRAMREAGYTPRGDQESTSYVIVGRVTAVEMNFCVRENTNPMQSSGSGRVSIDWHVVSFAGGDSVYQLSTTGNYELPVAERRTDGAREVFAGTYRDALRRLAADPGFRNAVAVAPGSQSARSSEGVLAIRPGARFTQAITANMDRILSSVAEVRQANSGGTAFVVDSRGYLLTNAHVVGASNEVSLRFNDGQSATAKVVRRDTLRDIALLKVERSGLRPIPIRTGKLTLTEKVFAVGNPLGLSQTVTDGIVSAYRQFPENAQEYIQASVAITFGNSGGPLLDASGNAVGVSVMSRGIGLGLNFFIPIESALQRLELRLAN
jgi:S1-C subfamily serine protease